MSGNTYVEAEGAAVVDGNIATVSSRPYYHRWMEAFLSMLEERAAKIPPAADERAKALAMASASSAPRSDTIAPLRSGQTGRLTLHDSQ